MATALAVPKVAPVEISENAWQEASWLTCRIEAQIAVRGFTVGDLLSIEVGSVVDAGLPSDAEISLHVNGIRVGCARLDSAGDRLGVRITELA